MHRISIREMLLATVIVALSIGWWSERLRVRELSEENVYLYLLVSDLTPKTGLKVGPIDPVRLVPIDFDSAGDSSRVTVPSP